MTKFTKKSLSNYDFMQIVNKITKIRGKNAKIYSKNKKAALKSSAAFDALYSFGERSPSLM